MIILLRLFFTLSIDFMVLIVSSSIKLQYLLCISISRNGVIVSSDAIVDFGVTSWYYVVIAIDDELNFAAFDIELIMIALENDFDLAVFDFEFILMAI